MSAPLPGRVPKRSILGRRRSREGARDGDCDRSDPEERRQDDAPDEARGGGGASVGGRTRRARQGGATRGPPRRSCGVRAATDPGRSGRRARAPGDVARPRAGPDPLRADAGFAVRVLSRRGGDHGPGSRRDAAVGADGAVLRGCAPVELRRVRLAGTTAGVRRQRFRRDAPGPVGVGRQAAGGEHDRSRRATTAATRSTRSGSCSTPSAGTARQWPSSPGCSNSSCGTPAWTSRT